MTQTTESTSTRVVTWFSTDGEFTCTEHGGSYLRSAAAASPRKRKHVTPLTTWQRVTQQDVAEWSMLGRGSLSCETCHCLPLV